MKIALQEIIESLLADTPYFLVSLEVRASRTMQRIVALVDSDTGIGIDECGKISHQITGAIEANSLIDTAYNIEVSSPGVDTPLQFQRQYPRNIGRTLLVKLQDGSTKTGQLDQVTEQQIVLREAPAKKPKKGEVATDSLYEISFDQIKEALVQISFK
jgi:ribosome maturation factor RimP